MSVFLGLHGLICAPLGTVLIWLSQIFANSKIEKCVRHLFAYVAHICLLIDVWI
jgi:hypothetical protein